MLRYTKSAALLSLVALVGCEQASQVLPLSSEAEEFSRTVPAEGALLSSVVGASVLLPPGAVPAGTKVSVAPVALSTEVSSGALASSNGLKIGPEDLIFSAPATASMKISQGEDLWLASVVVSSSNGVIENGDARVDLTNGIVESEISAAGTLMPVVPERAAVVRAGRISAAGQGIAGTSSGRATRELKGECGSPARRCADFKVEVSDNLLEISDHIAAIYPKISGEIKINGSGAKGRLSLAAPLRFKASKGTTISVASEISAEPTASSVVSEANGQVTITNVRVWGRVGAQERDETVTLTFTTVGKKAYVSLDQAFVARVGSENQKARIVAHIPLTRGE